MKREAFFNLRDELKSLPVKEGSVELKFLANADYIIAQLNYNAATLTISKDVEVLIKIEGKLTPTTLKPGTVLFRSDATRYVVLHEAAHYRQMAELGLDAYRSQGQLARETHVHKYLMQRKHLLSEREIADAK
ncbi:Rhs core protein OS=Escherichia coli DEC5D GN=ECDEC5D_1032 PE=4 SV=1: Tox-MPTase4 [Tuwongella immobilis]|uniref:Tox-MPTase4 domain-containing protein n=2 Tax=Tuwongella immobilis TaxID=692036 RepID=A0A6C2YIL1_9BACT|nr:Rhs core protein OS=Escherichia coli DEC5D GN=ECDEC5D_1032 PE=4 SV=1: Tox-MPTase4 [Tuwongella immobilis]VTR97062.1 Rhs core protein OS=Escherichia coli DEC5D GN=ECDEC5D_1032 PE=4 SV=1: Tox-MPTase4 [Tuwongella immobilis]